MAPLNLDPIAADLALDPLDLVRAMPSFLERYPYLWPLVLVAALFVCLWAYSTCRKIWIESGIGGALVKLRQLTSRGIAWTTAPAVWPTVRRIGLVAIVIVGAMMVWRLPQMAREIRTAKHAECMGTCQDILTFLREREDNAPPSMPRGDSWDEDTQRSIQYGTQTASLYEERFAWKVVKLYHRLRSDGYSDAALDRDYDTGVNALVIREVATHLCALCDAAYGAQLAAAGASGVASGARP